MHTTHPLVHVKSPRRMPNNGEIIKEMPRRVVGTIDARHRVVWVRSQPPPKKQERWAMSTHWRGEFYSMFAKW